MALERAACDAIPVAKVEAVVRGAGSGGAVEPDTVEDNPNCTGLGRIHTPKYVHIQGFDE